jgi:hypothetical protein
LVRLKRLTGTVELPTDRVDLVRAFVTTLPATSYVFVGNQRRRYR